MFALCLSGLIVGHSSAGWAGTKSFYIDRGDLLDMNDNPSGSSSGVHLLDGMNSAFGFSMVLPKDYKKNTKIRIRLFLVSIASCTFTLLGEGAIRSRTGKVMTSYFDPDSGLRPFAPVDVLSPPVAFQGFIKDYTLSPATSGPFTGSQLPEDRITVRIGRNGVADSCNSVLTVEDVKIIYRTP
jgi:hypothetical protein